MPERLDNIEFLGKGKLEIKIGGRRVVIEETAAPRGGKERPKQRFPMAVLDSLMPVLRAPFLDFGVTMEEGYWAELDAAAKFSPETACAKLRTAGIDAVTASKVLIARLENTNVARAFGDLNDDQVDAMVSLVADELRKYYNPQPRSLK